MVAKSARILLMPGDMHGGISPRSMAARTFVTCWAVAVIALRPLLRGGRRATRRRAVDGGGGCGCRGRCRGGGRDRDDAGQIPNHDRDGLPLLAVPDPSPVRGELGRRLRRTGPDAHEPSA